MSVGKVIKYFAFGSNMLSARMHINNPKATVVGAGKLNGYRFTFSSTSSLWKGATATLVEDKNNYVWGVIWDLPLEYLEILDGQEVGYDHRIVDVTMNGTIIPCKTYILTTNFTGDGSPSKAYKTVIVKGAEENNLTPEYCDFIKNFPDNGNEGPMDLLQKMLGSTEN